MVTTGPERFCAFCYSNGHWAQVRKQITDINETKRDWREHTGASSAPNGGIMLQYAVRRRRQNVLGARSHIIYCFVTRTKPRLQQLIRTSLQYEEKTPLHLVSLTYKPHKLGKRDKRSWVGWLAVCSTDEDSQFFTAVTLIEDLKLRSIYEGELTL